MDSVPSFRTRVSTCVGGRYHAFFLTAAASPYFGQSAWFQFFHREKIPSAVERYNNEIKRVFGVLESALSKEPSGYLVGGKLSIADIAFFTWNEFGVTGLLTDFDFAKEFPATAK